MTLINLLFMLHSPETVPSFSSSHFPSLHGFIELFTKVMTVMKERMHSFILSFSSLFRSLLSSSIQYFFFLPHIFLLSPIKQSSCHPSYRFRLVRLDTSIGEPLELFPSQYSSCSSFYVPNPTPAIVLLFSVSLLFYSLSTSLVVPTV